MSVRLSLRHIDLRTTARARARNPLLASCKFLRGHRIVVVVVVEKTEMHFGGSGGFDLFRPRPSGFILADAAAAI